MSNFKMQTIAETRFQVICVHPRLYPRQSVFFKKEAYGKKKIG